MPTTQKETSTPQHPSSDITIPDQVVQMASVTYTAMPGSTRFPAPLPSNSRRDTPLPTRSGPSESHESSSSTPTVMDSLDTIAHDFKELFGAMTKLEQLRVQKSEIPVPKIVVIGDQSAGKSSLIEAMSEIDVPRNAGTCTRCPIQITTSENPEPWKCEVSIVTKYRYFGNNLSEEEEEIDEFHPWVPSQQPTTVPFKVVQDKKDLCEVIQRAQVAILHPSDEPTKYVKGRIPKTYEVGFSPNYILLDITGPGLPSLSFHDLPGVIAHAEKKGEEYLVHLVKNLVRHYVRDEHCLVLLACSMETDIHTSNAFGIVRDEEAGDRCVGVLTKPDRAPEGHPASIWDEILSGQKFGLKQGYYVTKQPNQNQLGFSHKEARLMEDCYFEDQEPWAHELSKYKHLFGTKHLQLALSRKLAQIITATLPTIHTQLEERWKVVDEELRDLPEVAPHNAYHIVITCIDVFLEQAQLALQGEYPHNSFRGAWKQQKTQYRDYISALRPKYQLNSVLDVKISKAHASPLKGNSRDPIELEDDNRTTPCPVAFASPSKKRKIDDDSKDNVFATPTKKATRTPNTPGKAASETLNLDQVRSILESSSVSGRKGTYDPKAVDRLIQTGMKHWAKPSSDLTVSIEKALVKCLGGAFRGAFKQHDKTELYNVVWNSLRIFLDKRLKAHVKHAEKLLVHEQHAPSTENDDAYDIIRRKTLAELKGYRLQRLGQFLVEAEAVEAGKNLSDDALHAKLNKEMRRIEEALGPDPCQRELDAIADIRAYYTVASMRYVDNVTRSVEVEVFEGLRKGLKEVISDGVFPKGITDMHERCAQLLAEDQARARRRCELKVEKRQLEEARAVLEAIV